MPAAVLVSFVLAAPAQALDPAPTVLDFETPGLGAEAESLYPDSGASLFAFGGGSFARVDGCGVVARPGYASKQSLDVCSDGTLQVRFAAPQTTVSMWVALAPQVETSGTDAFQFEAWTGANPGEGTLVDRDQLISQPFGSAIVFGTKLAAPAIRSVQITTSLGSEFLVDDLAFSPYPSPDTAITSAPANPARSTDATFTFTANQSETGFACSLDNAAATSCRGGISYSGLAPGTHTFSVAARDRYGTEDRSPATYSWTVDLSPLLAAPPPDSDGDGVPDRVDDCPATANGSQGDLDRDGVGDACEIGEPGTLPPVNGERVVVEVLSGDVFVKLPASSAARLAQVAPIAGFVPLKGTAVLPTGTIVDARKGRLSLSSTVDGRTIGAGGRPQSATLAAGIFRIRQQRLARTSTRRIPTDFVLMSAPGAEAACVRTHATGPIKGRGRSIVRALSATTSKGNFRIVGVAAISSARNATWASQDRCDGTRTDVGNGKVTVHDSARKRTITVRAGRSYLAKARLFGVQKRR